MKDVVTDDVEVKATVSMNATNVQENPLDDEAQATASKTERLSEVADITGK